MRMKVAKPQCEELDFAANKTSPGALSGQPPETSRKFLECLDQRNASVRCKALVVAAVWVYRGSSMFIAAVIGRPG